MFADAYKKASTYTRPVVISTRFFDGSVKCAVGAFILLNSDGWVLTVAHLWETHFAYEQHKGAVEEYKKKVQAIDLDRNLTPKQKRKRTAKLAPNREWITNHSFWWGSDGVALKEVKALPEADLVAGRLEPFSAERVTAYPVVKDPTKNLDSGTALCKLGYPFYDIAATFDEANNAFTLAPNTFPVPRFPIEGIYTRNLIQGKSKDEKYEIKFLETSSPGLRGQSGGPVFDVKGTLWGIQSRTQHLPLGFSPKIKKNGREVEEHQFLNVGVAVHPEVILAFLRNNGIKFEVSDY